MDFLLEKKKKTLYPAPLQNHLIGSVQVLHCDSCCGSTGRAVCHEQRLRAGGLLHRPHIWTFQNAGIQVQTAHCEGWPLRSYGHQRQLEWDDWWGCQRGKSTYWHTYIHVKCIWNIVNNVIISRHANFSQQAICTPCILKSYVSWVNIYLAQQFCFFI